MSSSHVKDWEELELDPGATPSLPSPHEVIHEDLKQSVLQYSNSTSFNDVDIAATQIYDEATGNTIAEEAVRVAGPTGRIALLYCPALFRSLKESHPSRSHDELFEFDPRFQSLGHTTILPINHTSDVPPQLRHQFSVVIADLTQRGISLEDSMMLAHTLSKLHDPLKIILLAPKDIAGLGPEMQSSRVEPHCRGRADIGVYYSAGHFRL